MRWHDLRWNSEILQRWNYVLFVFLVPRLEKSKPTQLDVKGGWLIQISVLPGLGWGLRGAKMPHSGLICFCFCCFYFSCCIQSRGFRNKTKGVFVYLNPPRRQSFEQRLHFCLRFLHRGWLGTCSSNAFELVNYKFSCLFLTYSRYKVAVILLFVTSNY